MEGFATNNQNILDNPRYYTFDDNSILQSVRYLSGQTEFIITETGNYSVVLDLQAITVTAQNRSTFKIFLRLYQGTLSSKIKLRDYVFDSGTYVRGVNNSNICNLGGQVNFFVDDKMIIEGLIFEVISEVLCTEDTGKRIEIMKSESTIRIERVS